MGERSRGWGGNVFSYKSGGGAAAVQKRTGSAARTVAMGGSLT